VAELLIAARGRSKAGAAFRDMQRLSEMHYFHYPELLRICAALGFRVRDMREQQLRAGQFVSRKASRRALRSGLRTVGLEGVAYRAQRRWYVGMFELDLEKC